MTGRGVVSRVVILFLYAESIGPSLYPESIECLCTPSRFGCRVSLHPKRLGVHVRPNDLRYMYVQNVSLYIDNCTVG